LHCLVNLGILSSGHASQEATVRTEQGADCGFSHELLIAKFRLALKKVGKTTRSLKYDLSQISYDYTQEVTNRFNGLDLIEFVTLYRRQ